MLTLLPQSEAKRLRAFFRDAGYTEVNLKSLGFRDLASTRLRNMPRLLHKTREPNELNILLRWFWLGRSQAESVAAKFISPEFIRLLVAGGLLVAEGADLTPRAMVMEANEFLLGSDYPTTIDRGDSDLVLWPNPTSRLLLRMTIRRHSRATLDLGTGTGIQAMAAAGHSETVMATDLNARAANFAAFNAGLNGIENVEVLVGHGFEPADGRKFDLIVSNPPFFISPSSRYLFCNNRLELDQLCAQLVRQAPEFLNEDGYFEMLCEWAQVEKQAWQERISDWLQNTGCDAWVTRAYTRDPAEYAEDQIRSMVSMPGQDAEAFEEYISYYEHFRVQFIHGGTIVMRRRSGKNWILFDEIDQLPKEPFGDTVMRTFQAQDFLHSLGTDHDLLDAKPKLADDVRLEQVLVQDGKEWRNSSLTLKLVRGLPYAVGLQGLVAEFLSECDGSQSLRDATQRLAARVNAPHDRVVTECAQITRKLIQRGFLLI